MYKVHAYCFQKKKAHAYHAHFGKLKTRTLIARTHMMRTLMTRTLIDFACANIFYAKSLFTFAIADLPIP